MSFPVSNIRNICKERGTTLAEMERELKIGNGVIAKWENSPKSPPYDRLKMIADYLGVSVPILAGEQKEKPSADGEEQSPEEKELYEILDSASPDMIRAILEVAKVIKGNERD